MQLKLYENIKKFRKEKGMTQEELAEVLGVTVGAVSKWENGNNTPDIVMLTILADFFDVSIDVLLGYDISSKKVKDIVKKISKFVLEHNFDEAEALARDALTRYPHNFTVVHSAAMVFHVKAVECKDIAAAKESIRLLEKAKDYLSQNDDPSINEFTINNMIATDYMLFDEKKSLNTFKDNNFGGVNNPIISFAYLEVGDVKESLNYSTNAVIMNLFGLISSSIYMMLALACLHKKDKCEPALELADTTLRTIRLYKTEEVGYFSKYEALIHVIKAYFYALLKDEEMMEKCIKTGKRLAEKYDELASNDVAKNMRFYFIEKESFVAVDSIGKSAINGIADMLDGQFINIPGLDKKALIKVKDIWGDYE